MRTRILPLGVGAAAALAVCWPRLPSTPSLLWNTTASAPLGLWTLEPASRPVVGDWLAVRPPGTLAASLDARGVLPYGVPLVKQLAAVAPSVVCRRGADILIDGRARARAEASDRWGRPLPQWRGCGALHPGQLFLLNAATGSFDSRYFGPLSPADVVARARPWLIAVGGDHD